MCGCGQCFREYFRMSKTLRTNRAPPPHDALRPASRASWTPAGCGAPRPASCGGWRWRRARCGALDPTPPGTSWSCRLRGRPARVRRQAVKTKRLPLRGPCATRGGRAVRCRHWCVCGRRGGEAHAWGGGWGRPTVVRAAEPTGERGGLARVRVRAAEQPVVERLRHLGPCARAQAVICAEWWVGGASSRVIARAGLKRLSVGGGSTYAGLIHTLPTRGACILPCRRMASARANTRAWATGSRMLQLCSSTVFKKYVSAFGVL